MILLDSSVLVAFYNELDNHHAKATELMRNIPKDEQILLNDYLANEIATVVLRKSGLEKAKTVLGALLNNQKTVIRHTQKGEFEEIAGIFMEQTIGLSFVDCSIVWLFRNIGCKVETFDKALLDEIGKEMKKEKQG